MPGEDDVVAGVEARELRRSRARRPCGGRARAPASPSPSRRQPGAAGRDRREHDRVAVPRRPGGRAGRLRRRLRPWAGRSGSSGRWWSSVGDRRRRRRGDDGRGRDDRARGRSPCRCRGPRRFRRSPSRRRRAGAAGTRRPSRRGSARTGAPRRGRLRSAGAADERARRTRGSTPGRARRRLRRRRRRQAASHRRSPLRAPRPRPASLLLVAFRRSAPQFAQKSASAGSGWPHSAQATTGLSPAGRPQFGQKCEPHGQRRAALAAAGRDAPPRCGEHLVELVQPGVQAEQLVAALGEEVLAEAVLPVHLEHQPAEIAQPLVARALDGAPFAADHARRRQCTARRGGMRGSAEAVEQGHAPPSLRVYGRPVSARRPKPTRNSTIRSTPTAPTTRPAQGIEEEQNDPDHDKSECGSDHGGRDARSSPVANAV